MGVFFIRNYFLFKKSRTETAFETLTYVIRGLVFFFYIFFVNFLSVFLDFLEEK